MSELDRSRSETRAWLEASCPPSLRGKGGSELEGVWGGRTWDWGGSTDQKLWLERCAERGGTAPTWPRDYCGGGLLPEEREGARAGLRAPAGGGLSRRGRRGGGRGSGPA